MKVKELIEQLNTFSPDANVFVIYDTFILYEPSFYQTNADFVKYWQDEGMREGDVVMEVG